MVEGEGPRVVVSTAAFHASDRQGSNFESCVWRRVSSQSSHHPQEVLLVQFSLYVHKGGIKPDSFHFISFGEGGFVPRSGIQAFKETKVFSPLTRKGLRRPVSVRWMPSPPMSLAVNLVFTKHNLLYMLHLYLRGEFIIY